MNILPKKRWHVLTKENIARVRQDEAKYEEEQRQIKYRARLAEQEARTQALRNRDRFELASSSLDKRAVLLDERSTELVQGNKEYEAEKKSEKERQEKAIGLLTYLGQSVLESEGQKPWYDVHPRHLQASTSEKSKVKEEWEAKKKAKADPLTEMNKVSEWFEKRREEKAMEEAKLLQRANSCISAMPSLFPNDISVPKLESNSTHKDKRRKQKDEMSTKPEPSSFSNHGSSTEPTLTDTSNAIKLAKQVELDRLRAERLQRERKERERAALIMAKAMGFSEALQEPPQAEVPTDERNLPFNSAFNPELSAALAERRRRHRESRKRRHSPE